MSVLRRTVPTMKDEWRVVRKHKEDTKISFLTKIVPANPLSLTVATNMSGRTPKMIPALELASLTTDLSLLASSAGDLEEPLLEATLPKKNQEGLPRLPRRRRYRRDFETLIQVTLTTVGLVLLGTMGSHATVKVMVRPQPPPSPGEWYRVDDGFALQDDPTPLEGEKIKYSAPSVDGNRIAIAYPGRVVVLELGQDKPMFEKIYEEGRGCEQAPRVALSGDGNTVAIGLDGCTSSRLDGISLEIYSDTNNNNTEWTHLYDHAGSFSHDLVFDHTGSFSHGRLCGYPGPESRGLYLSEDGRTIAVQYYSSAGRTPKLAPPRVFNWKDMDGGTWHERKPTLWQGISSDAPRLLDMSGDGQSVVLYVNDGNDKYSVHVYRWDVSEDGLYEWQELAQPPGGCQAKLSGNGFVLVNYLGGDAYAVWEYNTTEQKWNQKGEEFYVLDGEMASWVYISADGRTLSIRSTCVECSQHVYNRQYNATSNRWERATREFEDDYCEEECPQSTFELEGGTLVFSSDGMTFAAQGRARERGEHARTEIRVYRTVAFPTDTPVVVSAPTDTSAVRFKPFNDKLELRTAIEIYLQDNSTDTPIAHTYGHPIGAWDVSSLTDLSALFKNDDIWNEDDDIFNEDISSWDVASVTDMNHMFYGATSFNQPLDKWNVASVTSMRSMFDQASSFNQPLNSWDVSSVTDMYGMFYGATSFNQPLDKWNVASVTSMRSMFDQASSFNQPLNSWDVSSVTDMYGMFNGARVFNQPLDSWNVSSVTNMGDMFYDASSFNHPLESWNVAGVTSMRFMFYQASSFNQPLNSWDVAAVTDMAGMFSEAYDFNQPLDSWNVAAVTSMRSMFWEAAAFNQPLDSWNVAAVTFLSQMFGYASAFNQPLGSWDVSAVTDMWAMFLGASSFSQPMNSWNVGAVTSMRSMFDQASSFNQPLNSWDVAAVTDMGGMFVNASSFNQPLNSWDVAAVTDMGGMFVNAAAFNQPLDSWDVSSVTDMYGMFNGARVFNHPLDSWDVSAVTRMGSMFWDARSFNHPLESWNVAAVTDMAGMFSEAYDFNQPLDSWNVSSVTDMSHMFDRASSFNQSLCSWGGRLASVDVDSMFDGATSCPSPSAPDLSANPPGPFCYNCFL
jgi:surface protein